MQTTAFWAVPYENERQSFIQFRAFTAENYKKIKQKSTRKSRTSDLRSSTTRQTSFFGKVHIFKLRQVAADTYM